MTRAFCAWTRITLAASLAIGAGACSQEASTPLDPADSGSLRSARAKNAPPQAVELDPAAVIESTNAALAAEDAPYRLSMIETITADTANAGITVLWKNVGNKQLGHDFVAGDPRRVWSGAGGTAITFAIDPFDGATFNGVSAQTTTAEIVDGMTTWNSVQCSKAGLNEVDSPVDLGVIPFINGLGGGSPFVVADIHFGGWQEVEYAGATIAATHTFIFTSGGVPTDVDGDGKLDVAFREIFFDRECQACAGSPDWAWEIEDGANDPRGRDIDIESIVLHEAGHGLSQAHFGIGFRNDDGTLHQTSNSVMAAAYAGPRTDLQGTDNAGLCSNWADWPNN